MKNILIATDFSEAAHNAAAYATELAVAFNARVILFNAYQLPLPVSETPVIISKEDLESAVQQQLESETDRINDGHRIDITIYHKEGGAAYTILEAAKEFKADLIVAGVKKAGKGMRRILGSTVTALARKSHIPLLVVPEEAKYRSVNTIALANENDIPADADSHILDSLHEIAERFHSKVYLVRVAENRFHEAFEVMNSPFKLKKMLSNVDPVYECIEGKDIPVALDDFAASYGVDVLALMPHHHSLLERWFSRSTTREMIFESRLPLLVIPELHKEKNQESPERKEFIL